MRCMITDVFTDFLNLYLCSTFNFLKSSHDKVFEATRALDEIVECICRGFHNMLTMFALSHDTGVL